MTKMPDDLARQAQQLTRQLQRLLRGCDPAVQSAVLADLLSIWLAGHWPPEAREELLTDFVELVLDLVPITEKQVFGPLGHPAGREKP